MSAAARSSLSVCRDLFFALWQFSRINPCRAPLQQKRHSTRFGFPFPEAAVTNAADLMSNRCVVFGSSPPGCASFPPPHLRSRQAVVIMWVLHRRSKDDGGSTAAANLVGLAMLSHKPELLQQGSLLPSSLSSPCRFISVCVL